MKPWQEIPPRRFGILTFDTFAAARSDITAITEKAKTVDQLNIVIKQDGNMDDPELTQHGKVFAGAAWALIHERRVQEGWYDFPH